MSRLPPSAPMRGQVFVALAEKRDAQRALLRRRRLAVTIAKGLLPVLALLLLVLLAVLPDLRTGSRIGRFSYKTGTSQGAVSRMSEARYRGIDAQGEPFTITATRAIQATPSRLVLSRPKGDMTLKSGAWMMLNANSGLYHQKTDQLALAGKVTLYRDDGTTLKTSHALIDMKGGTASGHDPVSAFGTFGTLHAASGFVVQDRGAEIIFKGPSHLVLDQVRTAAP
jgi:lipopolysaccharide export system protein LptC